MQMLHDALPHPNQPTPPTLLGSTSTTGSTCCGDVDSDAVCDGAWAWCLQCKAQSDQRREVERSREREREGEMVNLSACSKKTKKQKTKNKTTPPPPKPKNNQIQKGKHAHALPLPSPLSPASFSPLLSIASSLPRFLPFLRSQLDSPCCADCRQRIWPCK